MWLILIVAFALVPVFYGTDDCSWPIALGLATPLAGLAWCQLRHHLRGWQVRRPTFEEVRYSERVDDDWQHLTFPFRWHDRPPRVLVGAPESWNQRPAWAQAKREIILRRLRRSLPAVKVAEQDPE